MTTTTTGPTDEGPGEHDRAPVAAERPPNVFATAVEHRPPRGWCVTSMIDGERRVISWHATAAQARAAERVRNTTPTLDPPTT